MRRILPALAFLASTSGLATPALAETIHMVGTFPALARDIGGARRLAIERFGGRDGDRLGAAIAGRLTEPDAGAPPHFTLVPTGAASDLVLSGSAGTDVHHDDYDVERSRCAEKKDGKCVAREKYRVRCTRRTIAVTAEVRAGSPRDGRTAYAATKSRDDVAAWCEDETEPASVGGIVAGMIASIAYEVRTDIAPHTARYGIRVHEGRNGMPRDLGDRFKAAVKLVNHDERGGCAAFAELGGDHPSVAFNVALCAEAAGDYARAADLFRATLARAPRDGDAARALDRVGMLMTARADLAGQPRL